MKKKRIILVSSLLALILSMVIVNGAFARVYYGYIAPSQPVISPVSPFSDNVTSTTPTPTHTPASPFNDPTPTPTPTPTHTPASPFNDPTPTPTIGPPATMTPGGPACPF